MSTAVLHAPKLNVKDVIRSAVLAPSPDNNQPWKFEWRDNKLVVCFDKSRALSSDVDSMFSLLSIGAAIENARIAARHAGFETAIDDSVEMTTGQPRQPTACEPVATLSFTPTGLPADPLYSELPRRCTCRKPFFKQTVESEKIEKLTSVAAAFSGCRVAWITQPASIRSVARLVAACDRVRFECQSFHSELYRQLRLTEEEAKRTRDGLDVRTLELPPGGKSALRFLRSWRRMRVLAALRLSWLLTMPTIRQIQRSGAIGVLSVSTADRHAFLTAGRAMQRLWLTASKEDLSVHPLGSLPILLAREQLYDGDGLSPRHRRIATTVAKRMPRVSEVSSTDTIALMFRIGYARAPQHRSLRRDIADMLVRDTSTNSIRPDNLP